MAKKRRRRFRGRLVNPAKKLKKKRQADRRAEQVQEALFRQAYHELRCRYLLNP